MKRRVNIRKAHREFRQLKRDGSFYVEASLGAAYGSKNIGDAMTWVHVTGLEYNCT
jgi:hypothetical protein